MELSAYDQRCLAGEEGGAAQFAMSLLCAVAETAGAESLIDVSSCHLVGSYYSGEADIRVLQALIRLGGHVRVPTTLNASSACLEPASPSPESARCQAKSVISLYEQLGCEAALTCAPYHLPSTPALGENIAWAESNAVVYANSVLGARTNKTVQYVDVCAALTGRIPFSGLYLDESRRATDIIDCSKLPARVWSEPLAYQLLGLFLGYTCGSRVALLVGMQDEVRNDALRDLGSAAACSGNTSLFHVEGVTPEASLARSRRSVRHTVSLAELLSLARPYMGAPGDPVAAVCLGTPHYSLDQLRELARLVREKGDRFKVPVYVTTSRFNARKLRDELLLGELQAAGVSIVVDACTYYGDVVPTLAARVMTDSVKWAFYGAGNLDLEVILGSVEDCLESARRGRLFRSGGLL